MSSLSSAPLGRTGREGRPSGAGVCAGRGDVFALELRLIRAAQTIIGTSTRTYGGMVCVAARC
jgi:phage shock protein PspC (stress-responsive transcriptional regulator)